MSYLYLQEQEGGFWEPSYSDSKPCAPLRTTDSVKRYCCADKWTAAFLGSRSGTTSERSEERSGVVLACSREASRASHLAPLLGGGARQKTFGPRCYELSDRPALSSCLPKTSVDKPLTGQQQTSKRWATLPPAWKHQRKTWVQTIHGRDFGYLHTPTTKANYCADSMQKWPAARCFKTVFGRPTPHEPGVVDGLANRVERYRAIGNGQVPLVVAETFLFLASRYLGDS